MTYTPHNQSAGFLLVVIVVGLLAVVIEPTSPVDRSRRESFEVFVSGIRTNAIKGEVFYQRGDGKFNLEPGLNLEELDYIKSGPDFTPNYCSIPETICESEPALEVPDLQRSTRSDEVKTQQGHDQSGDSSRYGEDSTSFSESLNQVYDLIRIITPNTEVFITRPGIFRINALDAGRTDLIVRDGEAVMNGRRVKEKRSCDCFEGRYHHHGNRLKDRG